MDALTNNPPIPEYLALNYEALKAEIAAALAALGEIAIASDDDIVAAREKVKPLQTLQKKIEGNRVEEKQPFLDGERDVDAFFKNLRLELDKAVTGITAKANAYQTEKREAARKVEAAKARVAAMMQEKAPVPAKAAETTRVTTSTGAVAASGRVTWDYEVIDRNEIPRELMIENRDAIKAKVAGLKAMGGKIEDVKIPGVRIFEKIGTNWR